MRCLPTLLAKWVALLCVIVTSPGCLTRYLWKTEFLSRSYDCDVEEIEEVSFVPAPSVTSDAAGAKVALCVVFECGKRGWRSLDAPNLPVRSQTFARADEATWTLTARHGRDACARYGTEFPCPNCKGKSPWRVWCRDGEDGYQEIAFLHGGKVDAFSPYESHERSGLGDDGIRLALSPLTLSVDLVLLPIEAIVVGVVAIIAVSGPWGGP